MISLNDCAFSVLGSMTAMKAKVYLIFSFFGTKTLHLPHKTFHEVVPPQYISTSYRLIGMFPMR